MRGLLREVESRCRGLQDEVEESQARERRIIEDAEDARRRAAAEAGQSFPNRFWGLESSLWAKCFVEFDSAGVNSANLPFIESLVCVWYYV